MLAKLGINFSWNGYRGDWNKQDCKTDNDQMALSWHYSKSHGTNKPPQHEVYTFAEQHKFSLRRYLRR